MATLGGGTRETVEVAVDFASLSRQSGTGWTAAFDARSRSVKFKEVKNPSAAYLAGLRKGEVLGSLWPARTMRRSRPKGTSWRQRSSESNSP